MNTRSIIQHRIAVAPQFHQCSPAITVTLYSAVQMLMSNQCQVFVCPTEIMAALAQDETCCMCYCQFSNCCWLGFPPHICSAFFFCLRSLNIWARQVYSSAGVFDRQAEALEIGRRHELCALNAIRSRGCSYSWGGGGLYCVCLFPAISEWSCFGG